MKEIILYKLLKTRNLNSRITVKWLFETLKNDSFDFIVLNFTKIDFISRSAAHQLIIERKEFKKSIEFKNLNKTLEEMINKVSHSILVPTKRNISDNFSYSSF